MTLFPWDNKYEVGVGEIDDQHKKLVSIINELHEAMLLGKGRKVQGGIISELVDYTRYHFQTEEDKLLRYGFPGYAEHRGQHNRFISKLAQIQKKHLDAEYMVTLELNEFLKDWLSGHILGSDREYSDFLRSKGER